MTTEQELREIFEGCHYQGRAQRGGSRHRAGEEGSFYHARIRAASRQFSLHHRWQRRLFAALCRRYGLEPYRYRRQRYTTVMVRVPKSFVNETLWPEYLQIKEA